MGLAGKFRAAGRGLYGTMLEGAVGTAASAHLFSTFPHLAWGTELFGPLLLTEEVVRQPLAYADFTNSREVVQTKSLFPRTSRWR